MSRKINYSKYTELDIDVKRGMLMGRGININKGTKNLENVFIPWAELNSHLTCFGTTRMGKTRLLAFMARQVIEKGDHLFLIEPKGSEHQETPSWIMQYAGEFNSIRDIVYWSPERLDDSVKMNLLYEQRDEEATSTVIGCMKVNDEFYEDIANEILMTIFPALSFYQEIIDPLMIEIMKRMELVKATIEDPINKINKKMLGAYFDEDEDSIKYDVVEEMIESIKHEGDSAINNVKKCYSAVKDIYDNPSAHIPIRDFVTFEDLANFTSQDHFLRLLGAIEEQLKEAIKQKRGREVIQRGRRAINELKKLCEKDKGFYSKVATSYTVTLIKLSTGNIGRLLNESKINILKDKFYQENKRIIFIAQPFPMKYSKAADMSVKMLMSMLNNVMATVGVTGIANDKRTHVFIDEAGAVTSNLMLSLANKGGGLGVSLYLFSQSFADYVDALGPEGSVILGDNTNTKIFYRVNDDESAGTVCEIFGKKKKGDVSYASSEGENSRAQSKAVEEYIFPKQMITTLSKMTYLMKAGEDIFAMEAPFQRDPYLAIAFDTHKNKRAEVKSNYNFVEEQKNKNYY